MRKKRYFWNLKHHKELDAIMGLNKRMPELFASLAEACGEDTNIGGTQGMYPFLIFSSRSHDIKKTVPYDVNAENTHFLQATLLTMVN